jgi:hypothetical protein
MFHFFNVTHDFLFSFVRLNFPLTFLQHLFKRNKPSCERFLFVLQIFSPFFLVFDFFPLDFFSSFLSFFADQLNANDKNSRSNSRKLITSNAIVCNHTHKINLTQSASSSTVTSLTPSNETIATSKNPGKIRSKYERTSRKKHKRRRK